MTLFAPGWESMTGGCPMFEKRDQFMTLRLTESEKAEFRDVAGGQDVSVFVRESAKAFIRMRKTLQGHLGGLQGTPGVTPSGQVTPFSSAARPGGPGVTPLADLTGRKKS